MYVKKNKTKPGQPGHWKESKHLEAVTTYLATGNLSLTSRIINVPFETVKGWQAKDWWKEMVAEISADSDVKLSASLEKTINKSMAAVNDILENGDYHYDQKQGKIVRVPAKLKDVHKISVDLIDRNRLIKKNVVPAKMNEESTEGRLLKLAEQFASFVTKKVPDEKVVREYIEGEFEEIQNSISEERGAPVQPRAGMGAQEEAEQSQG